MSTDLALWLMATALGTVVGTLVALIWLGLRWCAAEWRRHSDNVAAIVARDDWQPSGFSPWDDRRDGPLPRTTDQAARYYDGLIERGEW